MPKPRKEQVSLDVTPYYFCTSRCVRRAFLCGEDQLTGNSYEHRRQLIEDKLLLLTETFAIDVCSYAIMSNHYHAVIYIDSEQALAWSELEVVERWHTIHKGNLLSQHFVRGESLSKIEQKMMAEFIDSWREQLMSISKFFGLLNESIARQANAEDQCTGRFWEGRFKSDALLDEAALASAMVYVDLNPIRAKMAKTPEKSEHTSIKRRSHYAQKVAQANHPNQQDKALMAFVGNSRADMPKGLPFRLTDYLELVDWTGRVIREDKRGAISHHAPPILERLNIDPQHWLFLSKNFESRCKGLVGTAYKLKATAKKLGYQRMPGAGRCIELAT